MIVMTQLKYFELSVLMILLSIEWSCLALKNLNLIEIKFNSFGLVSHKLSHFIKSSSIGFPLLHVGVDNHFMPRRKEDLA